jgi:hypothetical protein
MHGPIQSRETVPLKVLGLENRFQKFDKNGQLWATKNIEIPVFNAKSASIAYGNPPIFAHLHKKSIWRVYLPMDKKRQKIQSIS